MVCTAVSSVSMQGCMAAAGDSGHCPSCPHRELRLPGLADVKRNMQINGSVLSSHRDAKQGTCRYKLCSNKPAKEVSS